MSEEQLSERRDIWVKMVIRSYGDKKPTLGSQVYVDDSAVVIGDVRLGDKASVWPGAVLRADDDKVEIGERSAMMDLSFAEAPKGRPVRVGSACIVSHGTRLHGCVVGDSSLIGIGAIVLDGASIGRNSMVAAGSLVTPGASFPSGSFVMGAPAKVVREVTKDELAWIDREAAVLEAKAARYLSQK